MVFPATVLSTGGEFAINIEFFSPIAEIRANIREEGNFKRSCRYEKETKLYCCEAGSVQSCKLKRGQCRAPGLLSRPFVKSILGHPILFAHLCQWYSVLQPTTDGSFLSTLFHDCCQSGQSWLLDDPCGFCFVSILSTL